MRIKILLKSNGETEKVIEIEPCDHFLLEIDYFINCFYDSKKRKKNYLEIINQAKSLEKIIKS